MFLSEVFCGCLLNISHEKYKYIDSCLETSDDELNKTNNFNLWETAFSVSLHIASHTSSTIPHTGVFPILKQ